MQQRSWVLQLRPNAATPTPPKKNSDAFFFFFFLEYHVEAYWLNIIGVSSSISIDRKIDFHHEEILLETKLVSQLHSFTIL